MSQIKNVTVDLLLKHLKLDIAHLGLFPFSNTLLLLHQISIVSFFDGLPIYIGSPPKHAHGHIGLQSS